MTTENLEAVKANAEETPKETEVTSEPKETTSTETTPTLRDTPEFIEELAKAQSGWDTRNRLLETKLTQSKATAKESKDKHDALVAEREADTIVASLLKKYVDSGGDSEVAEEMSKAIRVANSKMSTADKKMEEAIQKEHDVFMSGKTVEYSKQYGIRREELLDCENEYEMQIKSLEYQIANPKKPEDEQKKKVDSAVGPGAGVDLSKLSPKEKIEIGIEQLKKK